MLTRQFLNTKNLLLNQKSYSLVNNCTYGFSRKFSEKVQNIRSDKNQAQQTYQNATNVADNSAAAAVQQNVGLNQFITRVYKASGLGVCGALAASQVAIKMGLPFVSPLGCGIGGLVLGLGGMFATMKQTPKQLTEYVDGNQISRTENSPLRIFSFGAAMTGLGLSASPLFAMAAMQNPMILPTAIGISSAVFGSASLYAYYKPSGSLLSWGSALYSGLLGMIGLQIVGGLTHLIMGPNLFSMMLHRADTFVGVGLFSAFVAYDTHVAIKSYQEGNADHLLTSLDFALDFWNILVRMVEILRMFTGND